jgi:hypothetical protein
MSTGDIRRGFTQANINQRDVNIFYGEVFIVSVIVGILLQSWLAFGMLWVILLVGINIPLLGALINLVLSSVWGLVGYVIGSLFTPIAGIVLGFLLFVTAIGVHRSAREYSNDLTDGRDRSR